VEALRDSEFLTPFGVRIRYPGDFPDTLPDVEKKAVDLAGKVKETVTGLLNPYI
jgi:hypothetical protein